MKTSLLIVLLVILALVGYQTYQINSLKDGVTGKAVGTAGSIDMSDWTEQEKMMYEHHGTLPARLQAGQQPTMVGGC
ncbi:hypothetical protein HY639_03505 [Candidatus Woesearchaeota archaeon]|nr:hypothetical protein [Candidatus Woesearchaeota archaeon]